MREPLRRPCSLDAKALNVRCAPCSITQPGDASRPLFAQNSSATFPIKGGDPGWAAWFLANQALRLYHRPVNTPRNAGVSRCSLPPELIAAGPVGQWFAGVDPVRSLDTWAMCSAIGSLRCLFRTLCFVFAKIYLGQGAGISCSDGPPAIVVKAQEDARCRSALMDMGYSIVRSEYVRQRREGLTAFDGLGALRPTLVFVQDWLKEERRRIIARTWLPFLLTMLATILAGLSFALVAVMLG